MKKQILMGMAMVMITSMAPTAFAAGPGKPVRPNVKQHMDLAEKEVQTKSGLRSFEVATYETMRQGDAKWSERLFNSLRLEQHGLSRISLEASLRKNFKQTMDLITAIKGLESMIAAGKGKASEASITSAEGIKSAIATLLNAAELVYAVNKPTKSESMTDSQFSSATKSLEKMMGEATKLATTYETAEANGFVKVLEAMKEISAKSPNLTPQEVLVEAIMKAKNLSREKALELLEKYKDCI